MDGVDSGGFARIVGKPQRHIAAETASPPRPYAEAVL